MPAQWTLQEAQSRLPELVKAANCGEPQFITSSTGTEAVLMSIKSYEKMQSNTPEKPSFVDFLLSAPQGDWEDTPNNFRLRDVDL